MKNKDKRELKPSLRFPEFRDAPAWSSNKLSEFIDLVSGIHLSPDEYGEEGPVPYFTGPSDFTDEIESVTKWTEDSSSTALKDDTLITVKGSGVGEIWYLCLPSVAMGRQLMAVRSTDCVGSFVYQFLHLKRSRFEDLASGNLIPGLSRGDILDLDAPFPEPDEQQKIADCLSSLDELIAAHSRKLDALKAHKKGLMQQLFPREGETLPRLRFPEFKDAREWDETTLAKVVEVASGQVDPTALPYSGLPHVGGDNIESHSGKLDNLKTASELGLTSGKYAFDEKDILYSKIRPVLNKVAAPDFKGICSADIYPLRPSSKELRRDYLLHLLLSGRLLRYATKHSARSKIPKINRKTLLDFKTSIPRPAEQKRIAECLASGDALINCHGRKLDALKAHKKGLMQQLFPSLES